MLNENYIEGWDKYEYRLKLNASLNSIVCIKPDAKNWYLSETQLNEVTQYDKPEEINENDTNGIQIKYKYICILFAFKIKRITITHINTNKHKQTHKTPKK